MIQTINSFYLFSTKSKSSPLVHCNFFFHESDLTKWKIQQFLHYLAKGLFSQQLNIHQQSSSVYLTLVENCGVLLFHGKLQGPQCRSSSTSIQSSTEVTIFTGARFYLQQHNVVNPWKSFLFLRHCKRLHIIQTKFQLFASYLQETR